MQNQSPISWHETYDNAEIPHTKFFSMEIAYKIFSEQQDLYGFFYGIFGNKRIFGKGLRDFLGVKSPSVLWFY